MLLVLTVHVHVGHALQIRRVLEEPGDVGGRATAVAGNVRVDEGRLDDSAGRVGGSVARAAFFQDAECQRDGSVLEHQPLPE